MNQSINQLIFCYVYSTSVCYLVILITLCLLYTPVIILVICSNKKKSSNQLLFSLQQWWNLFWYAQQLIFACSDWLIKIVGFTERMRFLCIELPGGAHQTQSCLPHYTV
jgi:hypothetical protein